MGTQEDFETKIVVKSNAPQILRKELANPKWQKELVNLGSVCDPYQPAEKHYEITRKMLLEFQRFKSPLVLATKSNLILRDIDLLQEMNEIMQLTVLLSISSINEQTRKKIEPRASSTKERLSTIKKLRSSGIRTGVLLMPIIPFLNDSSQELTQLFEAIANADASYVIPGILYLTGAAKQRFFSMIKNAYPELYPKLTNYYQHRSPPREYKNKLYKQFRHHIAGLQLYDTIAYRKQAAYFQPTIEQWLGKKEKNGE
jgi:DNA repair photolyase